ncbi:hypothetical protein chiPu_0001741 [Chiloscyllium punctatum]|uniref:Uncharacterized protein n=1 Tax=Chiloscyllium punctatum TaxID=137246 RepID=A0A401RYW0_CHIPU|nr:hypothetical protein [Chiloscyllium punctatum]
MYIFPAFPQTRTFLLKTKTEAVAKKRYVTRARSKWQEPASFLRQVPTLLRLLIFTMSIRVGNVTKSHRQGWGEKCEKLKGGKQRAASVSTPSPPRDEVAGVSHRAKPPSARLSANERLTPNKRTAACCDLEVPLLDCLYSTLQIRATHWLL